MLEIHLSLLATVMIVALVAQGWIAYNHGKTGAVLMKKLSNLFGATIICSSFILAFFPMIAPPSFLRQLSTLQFAAPFVLVLSYTTTSILFCFTGWLIGHAVYRYRYRYHYRLRPSD